MKKLIVILLVCMFVLSIAACGKKNAPEATLPVSGGNTETQGTEASVPADATQPTEATETSVAADDDTTQPTEDDNKNEPVTPDQGQPDTDEDEDIKVEIGGENGDIVLTPPDEDSSSDFVINFDDLIAAGNQ